MLDADAQATAFGERDGLNPELRPNFALLFGWHRTQPETYSFQRVSLSAWEGRNFFLVKFLQHLQKDQELIPGFPSVLGEAV